MLNIYSKLTKNVFNNPNPNIIILLTIHLAYHMFSDCRLYSTLSL